MNSSAKKALTLVGGGILLALAFWFALGIAYCIPTSWMQENLSQSAEILSNETMYPASHLTSHGAFDNFTVALMINETVQGGDAPFLEALESPYATSADLDVLQVLNVLAAGDASSLETGHIERYWHGYLVVLKPLMVFMNLKQIRLLFQMIFVVLLCLLTIKLYKALRSVGATIALAFAVSVTLFAGWEGVMTLPIFFSFAVAFAASLWACAAKLDRWGLFVGFAIIGAITVYFDYLDNPLLTFSFPMLIVIVRAAGLSKTVSSSASEAISFLSELKSLLIIVVLAGFGWLLGYACLWVMKWVLVGAVTGFDVIASSLSQVAMRVGATDAEYYGTSPMDALWNNVETVAGIKHYLFLAVAIAVISTVAFIVKMWQKNSGNMLARFISLALVVAVLSTLPFVWILALSNHSQIHAGIIVYRTQLIAYAYWFFLAALPIVLLAEGKRAE